MNHRFLAIESASKTCSVALFEGSKLIDQLEEGGDYSHAEKLAPFVDQLLKKNDLKPNDLSAIGISSGPGSYTGLRIGLSLAKGLAVGSQLPLIAIPTLDGMSWGARNSKKDEHALYCPMLDARRMEVYTALYKYDGSQIVSTEAKVIDENSFQEELAKHKIYFFGDGAAKCADTIDSPNAIFLDVSHISARNFGELIAQKFASEEFEDLAYFEPNYFKDFRAGQPKKLL